MTSNPKMRTTGQTDQLCPSRREQRQTSLPTAYPPDFCSDAFFVRAVRRLHINMGHPEKLELVRLICNSGDPKPATLAAAKGPEVQDLRLPGAADAREAHQGPLAVLWPVWGNDPD